MDPGNPVNSFGDDLLRDFTRQNLGHASEALEHRRAVLLFDQVGKANPVGNIALEVPPRLVRAWGPARGGAMRALGVASGLHRHGVDVGRTHSSATRVSGTLAVALFFW